MNAKAKKPEVLEPESTEMATVAPITPMQLLEQATANGADVGQLTAIMDLQERWEAGEAQKKYTAAMALFQADCPFITKVREGHNSSYANLADTLQQIKGLMKTHGFVHSWKTDQIDGILTVSCCVTHIGGHKEFASMSAGADNSGSKNAVQAIGSTNTYLQRYTLFSVLGLASRDQDDDANSAISHEAISLDQETSIIALIEETGIDKAKFLAWAKAETVGDILASNYDKVHQELNSKKKAMAEK
ncbi:MAG: ERF family protein [Rhodospirillaceae bacterium]|nr:ERF family protein [Rhodospirillaceae bacterium]